MEDQDLHSVFMRLLDSLESWHSVVWSNVPQYDQLPVGLIAQLEEHCTGIAEVMGSIPVKA